MEEDGAEIEQSPMEQSSIIRAHIKPLPDAWQRVTERVIGCAMEVHSTLGPGLLEKIYEAAICHELLHSGLEFQCQSEITVRYKGLSLPGQRLDLVVANLVVVELKAVEEVRTAHLAQLVSYMRAADLPLGLLINFNVGRLKDGVFRRINERAFPPSPPS